VHHGLSPNADAWLDHCRATCVRWAAQGALMFAFERIAVRPEPGASIEAWAREARYAALRRMALSHGASLVLLAHHRRDQAETLLLQALRGAGVTGLAGMPASAERDGITWARPWLSATRTTIDAYLRRHRLEHIDDESNADPRFARNRLRLQVWPQLVAGFPQAEASLAAAAGWAGEASSALTELAAHDLERVAPHTALDLAAWQALSAPRRSNALRAWVQRHAGRAASAALVARLSAELPRCRSARWPLAGGEMRCHRGLLTWHAKAESAEPDKPPETTLCVRRAGTYRLPGWRGALKATRVRAGGIALATLSQIELSPRSGSEQFQAGPARPPRSLKKQYQAAGVPAWQRNGPLLYSAGRLVFVPGLGIDARALAGPGEAQLALDWIAADTSQ
ncbi:MAG: tRNA lysidine(34) synthetase TilS, partial [Caldimonas sp.]